MTPLWLTPNASNGLSLMAAGGCAWRKPLGRFAFLEGFY